MGLVADTIQAGREVKVAYDGAGNAVDAAYQRLLLAIAGRPLRPAQIKRLPEYKALSGVLDTELRLAHGSSASTIRANSVRAQATGRDEAARQIKAKGDVRMPPTPKATAANRLPGGKSLDARLSAIRKAVAKETLARAVVSATLPPGEARRRVRAGVERGRSALILVCQNEAVRHHRTSKRAVWKQNGIIGFRRYIRSQAPCVACIALAGKFYPVETELEDHPGCWCETKPELGQDTSNEEAGDAWLREQTQSIQRARLGWRYSLWKKGRDLLAFVETSVDDTYGPQARVRPNKSIRRA